MKAIKLLIFVILFMAIPVGVVMAQQDQTRQTTETQVNVANTVQTGPNNIALVVGINKYDNGWPKRKSSVQDAEKIAKGLEQNGFSVLRLFDEKATSKNIREKFNSTTLSAGKKGQFIFYYSGHEYIKQTDSKQGPVDYVVPIDSSPRQSADFISIDDLNKDVLTNCNPANTMMFIDSSSAGGSISRSEKGSVFADVLENGLVGGADVDKNGTTTLPELTGFVERKINRLAVDNTSELAITPDMEVSAFVEKEVKVYSKKKRRRNSKPVRHENLERDFDDFDKRMEDMIEKKLRDVMERTRELDPQEIIFKPPRFP